MTATRQETRRPLWQGGSHLRHHTTPSGARHANGARVAGRAGSPVQHGRFHEAGGSDDVAEWMRLHPRNQATIHPDDLPGGEIVPQRSGVLGVYDAIAYETGNILDRCMEPVEMRAQRVNLSVVPSNDPTNTLLATALALPLTPFHQRIAS